MSEAMTTSPQPTDDAADVLGRFQATPSELTGAMRTIIQTAETDLGLEDLQLGKIAYAGLALPLTQVDGHSDEFKRKQAGMIAFAERLCKDVNWKYMGTVLFTDIALQCFAQASGSPLVQQTANELVRRLSLVEGNGQQLPHTFALRVTVGIAFASLTEALSVRLLQSLNETASRVIENKSSFGRRFMSSFGVVSENLIKSVPVRIFQEASNRRIAFVSGIPVTDPALEKIAHLIRNERQLHEQAIQLVQSFGASLLRAAEGSKDKFAEIATHYLTAMAIVIINDLTVRKDEMLTTATTTTTTEFGRKRSAKKGRGVRTGRR
jgi:hypothetical protein